MKERISHPDHYNFGMPEVIDIIDAWGFAGDFYAGNVLKYFLRAPYKTKEEEDYRKAMWYLDKIYERNGECEIKSFNSQSFKTVRLKIKKINLEWFKPVHSFKGNKHYDIAISEVIKGWNLSGNRRFFIEHFHYSNFNCDACIKALSDLIDEVSEGSYEE